MGNIVASSIDDGVALNEHTHPSTRAASIQPQPNLELQTRSLLPAPNSLTSESALSTREMEEAVQPHPQQLTVNESARGLTKAAQILLKKFQNCPIPTISPQPISIALQNLQALPFPAPTRQFIHDVFNLLQPDFYTPHNQVIAAVMLLTTFKRYPEGVTNIHFENTSCVRTACPTCKGDPIPGEQTKSCGYCGSCPKILSIHCKATLKATSLTLKQEWCDTSSPSGFLKALSQLYWHYKTGLVNIPSEENINAQATTRKASASVKAQARIDADIANKKQTLRECGYLQFAAACLTVPKQHWTAEIETFINQQLSQTITVRDWQTRALFYLQNHT